MSSRLNISRRSLLKLGAAATAQLSMPVFGAGCGRTLPPGAPLHAVLGDRARRLAPRGQSLTLLYPKGSLGNLAPVARLFQEFSGIELDLVEANLDEISADMILSQTLSDSGRFDIAIPATFALPDLVESGALAPLDAFAQKYEPADGSARSLYSVGDRYHSTLYGYQTDGDVYTMFYLADGYNDADTAARYADENGRALAVPQTWTELERQMAFFHRPDAGHFGGSLFRNLNYVGWEFWARLHSKGVFPLGPDFSPRFNTAEARDALKDLIRTSRFLAPDVATNGLFENFTSFADGNKFCNVGWGGTQKHLRSPSSSVRDRLLYGPIPGAEFEGQELAMPYFNWGWNYVVSSRSAVQEIAYLFILFATTPVVSAHAVQDPTGYFDPFRAEHYQDPAIIDIYGADYLTVHEQSLRSCMPDFYVRGQGRYLQALKHAVHGATTGRLQPSDALAALDDRWNRLTDELGRDHQIEQWSFLRDSYPAAMRAVLR